MIGGTCRRIRTRQIRRLGKRDEICDGSVDGQGDSGCCSVEDGGVGGYISICINDRGNGIGDGGGICRCSSGSKCPDSRRVLDGFGGGSSTHGRGADYCCDIGDGGFGVEGTWFPYRNVTDNRGRCR
jgi:hypothetical protein